MNAEVIKAINRKKSRTNRLKKWWNKNGYKIRRVIFFPVYIAYIVDKKLESKINSLNVWSDERANEILSYYIPRRAKWHEDEKEFYFFDNGFGWGSKICQKKLKIKDRRWWNCHICCWGGKIREYLIQNFELKGFEKKVLDTEDGQTEIIFKMIEKTLDKMKIMCYN